MSQHVHVHLNWDTLSYVVLLCLVSVCVDHVYHIDNVDSGNENEKRDGGREGERERGRDGGRERGMEAVREERIEGGKE